MSLQPLREFMRPEPCELDAFEAAKSAQLSFEPKKVIRAQGAPVRAVYFLRSGWVASRVATEKGQRQIVKLHLPGDLLGAPSMALERAAETLIALDPVRVDVIPLDAFAQLFEAAPRLALSMFLTAQQERVFLMDRVTALGSMSALQRFAAFFVQIHDRLEVLTPGLKGEFELPLTHEQLGQVTGVTPVHVVRTLRELGSRGLMQRQGRKVLIRDIDALRELAALPKRKTISAPDWLLALRQRTT